MDFDSTDLGTIMTAHCECPEGYPRRVLLAVTGLSPQIVTETLYVLAVKQKWIPTEIQVTTMARGARSTEAPPAAIASAELPGP